MLAQHFVLGGLPDLMIHFGSLLKKLLFLGRTLLLRLWVLGTHVQKPIGRLGEQPEQLGASNPVLVQECWRTRLGRLARRRLLGWLVGWLVGW